MFKLVYLMAFSVFILLDNISTLLRLSDKKNRHNLNLIKKLNFYAQCSRLIGLYFSNGETFVKMFELAVEESKA